MTYEIVGQDILREHMLREKQFLAQLYLSKDSAVSMKTIVNASELQLQVLLTVIHYICRGLIPVKTKFLLKKSPLKNKKKFIFETFRSTVKITRLLNEDKATQVIYLLTISKV